MNKAQAMRLRRSRLACEWRALCELWFWPLACALLPYRAGIALARWVARSLTLYDEQAQSSLVHWRSVVGDADEDEWLARYRFTQLVDHADLFWMLLRGDRFALERLAHVDVPLPKGRPLVVLSYHYGQGLCLVRWLRERGFATHFVSVRWDRASVDSTLTFHYGRLRLRIVERLASAAPIYVGGARRAVAQALASRESVYGLVDVPVRAAATQHGNGSMFGMPVLLPDGLADAARESDAPALILTCRVRADGARIVDAKSIERAGEATSELLARELERRVRDDSAAWHFWYLWGAFAARGPSGA